MHENEGKSDSADEAEPTSEPADVQAASAEGVTESAESAPKPVIDLPQPTKRPDADTESDEEPVWKPSPYPRTPSPAPAVVTRRRRVGRAGWLTGRIAIGLVSVLALGATGYAYVTTTQVQNNVPTTDVLTPRAGEPPAPPADDGGTDILLVGSDARTDAQGNQLPASMLKSLRTEGTPESTPTRSSCYGFRRAAARPRASPFRGTAGSTFPAVASRRSTRRTASRRPRSPPTSARRARRTRRRSSATPTAKAAACWSRPCRT